MEDYEAANDCKLLRQPDLPMEVLKLHTAIPGMEIENLRGMTEELEELEDDVELEMLLTDQHGVEERANSLDVELDDEKYMLVKVVME
jgi:hypothetical protein